MESPLVKTTPKPLEAMLPPEIHQAIRQTSPLQAGALYEAWTTAQKSDGLFYTPPFLAHYLVEQTLGKALEERKKAFFQLPLAQQRTQFHVILTQVQQLRILDPACGCGIFLLCALQAFQRFYHAMAQGLLVTESPDSDWAHSLEDGPRVAVEQQLFGVDIDPVALSICQQGLYELLGKNVPRPDYLPNLWAGDGLMPLPFQATEWDFILGNPPYITEVRDQAALFRRIKEHSVIRHHYHAKMDLCDAFLALGVEALAPGGQLAYVLPEYWTQRSASRTLRTFVQKECDILEYWRFGTRKLFARAPGHHTSLLLLERRQAPRTAPDTQTVWLGDGQAMAEDELSDPKAMAGALQLSSLLHEPRTGVFMMVSPQEGDLLETLSHLPQKLLTAGEIQQGIVIPQGRLRRRDWERLSPQVQAQCKPNEGIFLLNEEEVTALNLSPEESALLRPAYTPSDLEAFVGIQRPDPPYQMIYGNGVLPREGSKTYGRLQAHLDRFFSILTSAHAPYGLHRPRQAQWFEASNKVMGVRQTMQPTFGVVPQPAYVSEGIYVIAGSPYPSDVLAGLLNASVAWFWFYHQKRKGHRLQIDKDVLLSVPAPPIDGWEQPVAEVSATLRKQGLSPQKRQGLVRELNHQVYQAYGLKPAHLKTLEAFLSDRLGSLKKL